MIFIDYKSSIRYLIKEIKTFDALQKQLLSDFIEHIFIDLKKKMESNKDL